MKVKIIKNTRWILLIFFLEIFIVRFITSRRFSIEYGELIFLVVIGLSMFVAFRLLKNKYTNMALFSMLSFLLIGFFPYSHYLCYSSNRDNYSFNPDYLNQRTEAYKKELKYFKDSSYVQELSRNLNKIDVSLKFDYSHIGKEQRIGNYTFILKQFKKEYYLVKGAPRPRNFPEGETNKFLIIKGNEKFNFEMINEDFISETNHFLNQKKMLTNKIKNSKQYIPFSDIWLDSVTGFVFAFIKPLSKTSQIIRLLQLVTAYFFFQMIASWIKQSRSLNIEKVEK
ncbi:hypothetical protein [Flavobacterium faecale]|uniref:hypothetical protein n=1 Tax=Flavobacterium faecale TaxID=1355330 RepID=UPI003AAE09F3